MHPMTLLKMRFPFVLTIPRRGLSAVCIQDGVWPRVFTAARFALVKLENNSNVD